MFKVKRVYEDPEKSDGLRVLVDRLWPRSLTKEAINIDMWMKDVAPSNELRKKFGHDPDKWDSFVEGYGDELTLLKKDLVNELKELEKVNRVVTLLCASKDPLKNNAIVLQDFLN